MKKGMKRPGYTKEFNERAVHLILAQRAARRVGPEPVSIPSLSGLSVRRIRARGAAEVSLVFPSPHCRG